MYKPSLYFIQLYYILYCAMYILWIVLCICYGSCSQIMMSFLQDMRKGKLDEGEVSLTLETQVLHCTCVYGIFIHSVSSCQCIFQGLIYR